MRDSIQADRASDDARIGGKAPSPELLAEHHDRSRTPGVILGFVEHTTAKGVNTQQWKIRSGDPFGLRELRVRVAAARHGQCARGIACRLLEALLRFPQQLEAGKRPPFPSWWLA